MVAPLLQSTRYYTATLISHPARPKPKSFPYLKTPLIQTLRILGDPGADHGAGEKSGRAENDGEGGGEKGEGRNFPPFSFPLRPLRRRFPLAPISRPPHDPTLGLQW